MSLWDWCARPKMDDIGSRCGCQSLVSAVGVFVRILETLHMER